MDRNYLDSLLADDDADGTADDTGHATTGDTTPITVDGDSIHVSNATFTDELAAQYLGMLDPADRTAAMQRMLGIGSYALLIGTRQAAAIDVRTTVADALQEPLEELIKSITHDANDRERRILEAIVRKREKALSTPALAGGEFEDVVEQLLRTLSLDDVVDRTSRSAGVDGDAGDICVDSPDGIRVVFECKRGYESGMSRGRMLSELGKAKANRQANAGVIVLDTLGALGGRRLRRLSPVDYAVVVGREEGEDGLGLQCALLLSRSNVAVGRREDAESAVLAQHAEELHAALEQHDKVLTLFNNINDEIAKGRGLVEDARRVVRNAALRLAAIAQLDRDATSPIVQADNTAV